MAKHKLLSIEEQGGLQVYLEKMGVDYPLFILMLKVKTPDTVIGRVLARKAGKEKPFISSTISNWKEIYKKEQNNNKSVTI
jgi:hypothetical protein